jgi:hypothetical protein
LKILTTEIKEVSMNAHNQGKIAQDKDNEFIQECKVITSESGYEIVGNFRCVISKNANINELDPIEQHIEQLGQQFKRIVCRETLEAADENNVRLFRLAQPRLRKNGKSPFTIITRFGRIRLNRQRMLDPQTGKTMTPSGIVWETSQNRHVTRQVIDAACDASQAVSYRKAAGQLAEESGEEKLLSTTTVWNKKQMIGKELEQKHSDFAEQALTHFAEQAPTQDTIILSEVPPEQSSLEEVATDAKPCRIAENTIQAQLDEVVTKSQEPGKKTNKTYTATLETSEGECFYLAAKSSQELIQQVMARLMMLGLFLGKRLEVISDGARWIGEWVDGMTGREQCDPQSREQCDPHHVEVEHVLCWYHLCKRIYEGLGAMGLPKDKRKALEREILGHLWRGETAQAVWILWGLRSSARIPQRIDDLMGYLLRKKHTIVNYAARREQRLWLASTRVEKWNDVAVSERCKHRGMSWTSQGVLAIALYAAEQKRKSKQITNHTAQFHLDDHTTP